MHSDGINEFEIELLFACFFTLDIFSLFHTDFTLCCSSQNKRHESAILHTIQYGKHRVLWYGMNRKLLYTLNEYARFYFGHNKNQTYPTKFRSDTLQISNTNTRAIYTFFLIQNCNFIEINKNTYLETCCNKIPTGYIKK